MPWQRFRIPWLLERRSLNRATSYPTTAHNKRPRSWIRITDYGMWQATSVKQNYTQTQDKNNIPTKILFGHLKVKAMITHNIPNYQNSNRTSTNGKIESATQTLYPRHHKPRLHAITLHTPRHAALTPLSQNFQSIHLCYHRTKLVNLQHLMG